MKLRGYIGGVEVLVLIDSRATHNFVSLQLIEPLQLKVVGKRETKVTLGNGKAAKSYGICKQLELQLPDVRPYRYPQLQKDEIEILVGEMLESRIIRPSTMGIPPNLNEEHRYSQNSLPHPRRTLRIPGYAARLNQCAVHLPILDEQETDVSGHGVGAVLMQEGRPIAYFSQVLGPRAQAKCVYEWELMAIVLAVQKYLTGLEKENGVVDALSRRGASAGLHMLSVSTLVIHEQMKQALCNDPEITALRTQIETGAESSVAKEGLVYYRDRLDLPRASEWILQIFREVQGGATRRHEGTQKTYQMMARDFFCIGMRRDIAKMVDEYVICQRNKYSNLSPAGLLYVTPRDFSVVGRRQAAEGGCRRWIAVSATGSLGYWWRLLENSRVRSKLLEPYKLVSELSLSESGARVRVSDLMLEFGYVGVWDREFYTVWPAGAQEEVNNAFNNMIPELINQVRDQLTALLEERLPTVTAAGGGPQRGFTYRDFAACSPPEFKGKLDPSVALRWVSDMEGVFHTCGCPENLKVSLRLEFASGTSKRLVETIGCGNDQGSAGSIALGRICGVLSSSVRTSGGDRADHPRLSELQAAERKNSSNSHGQQSGSGRQQPTCFKCGQPGHVIRDCKQGLRLCFNYGQGGHLKNECPHPKASGTGGGNVRAPAPSTLRITDGRSGTADTQPARGRAFQLMVEEAQAAPKAVTGTYFVNSMPALVLFDSGATHSFVSLSFCALWDREAESLGHVLIVDVADGRTVSVTDVYRSCCMEFLGTKFEIDLIPIAMKELCVIVGMDWLDSVRAVFDCHYKQVWVRTPSGGELVNQGNTSRHGAALRSIGRAQRHSQHGGRGLPAYVRDTRELGPVKTAAEVPVVQDYADVFPEELPGSLHSGTWNSGLTWCLEQRR
ncbi:hypothetical protein OSB04_032262 [Centaurea solstitialis]|uniref:CCHC-type domain-containing protein n=1 Tax=Centaurea solstitialis TaxID=347529 RepID=A0AA38SCD6_9ASTR|nr:hypothetical protein OSB04_032262 [Centaurea solstitialis]